MMGVKIFKQKNESCLSDLGIDLDGDFVDFCNSKCKFIDKLCFQIGRGTGNNECEHGANNYWGIFGIGEWIFLGDVFGDQEKKGG